LLLTIIRIAIKICIQPIQPNNECILFPIQNPNKAANTGSSVKMIAIVAGL